MEILESDDEFGCSESEIHRFGFPKKLSSSPPLMNETGIGPERRLFEKFMELGSRSQRLSGIEPVNLFPERSRTFKDLSEESESGM